MTENITKKDLILLLKNVKNDACIILDENAGSYLKEVVVKREDDGKQTVILRDYCKEPTVKKFNVEKAINPYSLYMGTYCSKEENNKAKKVTKTITSLLKKIIKERQKGTPLDDKKIEKIANAIKELESEHVGVGDTATDEWIAIAYESMLIKELKISPEKAKNESDRFYLDLLHY